MSIVHRTVRTNGIDLHVAEEGTGKPVVLCHGFPESWYSWRHQLPVLADAGYRAIAPDLRGYGDSDHPSEVTDYDIVHLTDDLLGLLDDVGEERAVFVGHDWGAILLWDMARMHPERMSALVGVSVPFIPWPVPPTQLFEQLSGGDFFYVLYFQDVGPAERELEADPRRSMARVLWSVSGDAIGDDIATLTSSLPREGTGFLDSMLGDPPAQLPPWLTDEDIDVYAEQFANSGFFGPVSYYRNWDGNWERNKDLGPDRITMPTFFITGERDPVPRDETAMKSLPDYRGSVIIPKVGHWTQQENPEAFNEALLGFLKSI